MDEVTNLDAFVAELSGSGHSLHAGLLMPTSVRLDFRHHAMIDAMASHMGTTRNKVINQLVDISIESALKALPTKVVKELRARAAENAARIIESKTAEGGTL